MRNVYRSGQRLQFSVVMIFHAKLQFLVQQPYSSICERNSHILVFVHEMSICFEQIWPFVFSICDKIDQIVFEFISWKIKLYHVGMGKQAMLTFDVIVWIKSVNSYAFSNTTERMVRVKSSCQQVFICTIAPQPTSLQVSTFQGISDYFSAHWKYILQYACNAVCILNGPVHVFTLNAPAQVYATI